MCFSLHNQAAAALLSLASANVSPQAIARPGVDISNDTLGSFRQVVQLAGRPNQDRSEASPNLDPSKERLRVANKVLASLYIQENTLSSIASKLAENPEDVEAKSQLRIAPEVNKKTYSVMTTVLEKMSKAEREELVGSIKQKVVGTLEKAGENLAKLTPETLSVTATNINEVLRC